MISKLKIRKIIIVGMFVFCSFISSVNVFASETSNEELYDEEETLYDDQMPDYTNGKFKIGAAVDSMFSGYHYLFASFYNTDTKEVYKAAIDLKEQVTNEVSFPIGHYILSDANFEDNAMNVTYSIYPEEFTLTENGVENVDDNIIWVNVKYLQTQPMEITNLTLINDGNFNGSALITYYDISDAVYNEDHEQYQKYIYHASTIEKGAIKTSLYAGHACISNINIYDETGNPLNVYYDPNYFEIDRNKYSTGEYEQQFIYAFNEESELSSEQIKKIKEGNFILKEADKMLFPNPQIRDEMSNILEKNIIFPDRFTFLENDLPEDYMLDNFNVKYQVVSVDAAETKEQDLSIETETISDEISAETESNVESLGSKKIAVIISVIAAIAVIAVFMIIKKKKR